MCISAWDLRTRNNIPNNWKMHCQDGQNHISIRYPVHHPLLPGVAARRFLNIAIIVVERNTHWSKIKFGKEPFLQCDIARKKATVSFSEIYLTFSSKGKLKEILWRLLTKRKTSRAARLSAQLRLAFTSDGVRSRRRSRKSACDLVNCDSLRT